MTLNPLKSPALFAGLCASLALIVASGFDLWQARYESLGTYPIRRGVPAPKPTPKPTMSCTLSHAVDNFFWERRKGWVWPLSMFIHNLGMTLAIPAAGAVAGLLLCGLVRRATRDSRVSRKVQS